MYSLFGVINAFISFDVVFVSGTISIVKCFLSFQILLSMGIGWLICGILTTTGVLTNNPDKKEYKARTDSGLNIIAKTPWFYMPYPGKKCLSLHNVYTAAYLQNHNIRL